MHTPQDVTCNLTVAATTATFTLLAYTQSTQWLPSVVLFTLFAFSLTYAAMMVRELYLIHHTTRTSRTPRVVRSADNGRKS